MGKMLVAIFACLALAGCAASGVRVTSQQMTELRKGETTIAEVTRAFGPPTSKLVDSRGQTTLIYSYAEVSARAVNFVPFVGIFAGGHDVRSSSAVLRFDAAGRLIDYTSSESQFGAGRGISAGAVSAQPVPQPRQNEPLKPADQSPATERSPAVSPGTCGWVDSVNYVCR